MTNVDLKNKIRNFHLSYFLWIGLLIVSITPSYVFATEGYLLGEGDTVKITVYEQPDLTAIVRISHVGAITYPLLGEVTIGGLTPEAAGRLIASRLEAGKFVKAPQVSVTVVEYRSQQISVLGQINKPGKYALDKKTLLVELLAQSGGLKDNAADVITVVRSDAGKSAIYQIDLLKFYQGDMLQNIEMVNGDIILVPKMDVFYIYGEVNRPGVYRLERGMTTMQALSVGGGLTGRGSSRGIKINRRRADGVVQKIEVELTDALQPNDVLFVDERLF